MSTYTATTVLKNGDQWSEQTDKPEVVADEALRHITTRYVRITHNRIGTSSVYTRDPSFLP